MKIISKFKDFYDPVAYAMGVDSELMYIRKTGGLDKDETEALGIEKHVRIEIGSYGDPRPYPGDKKKLIYEISTFFVGFCGKTYHGIRVDTYTSKLGIGRSFDHEYYYGEDAKNFLKKFDNTNRYWRHLRAKAAEDFQFPQELFSEHNVPVFLGEYERGEVHPDFVVYTNPNLSEVKFVKVIDPYTAFQELSMYLGGVLRKQEPDMVEVSEKDKLLQHGFDPKYSFRKEPGKPKPRKGKKK